MSSARIHPLPGELAPPESARVLAAVRERLGRVPATFHTLAHSPAVLRAYWQEMREVERMTLEPRLRVAIGLRVSEVNGCVFCLQYHESQAEELGLSDSEMSDLRKGRSDDARTQAVLALVAKVMKDRGHHAGFIVEAVRRMGVTDAQVVEVLALVGLFDFTSTLHAVAGTQIDPEKA